jgi:nucleoside phosphorylase
MESLVPSERVDVLIFAAHGPDLRGLRTHLGERMAGNIRGLHVAAKTVGVGMPVAGGAAAKRVFQLLPRAVIHLGTCGIYPGLPAYRPHDVLVGEKLQLIDAGVRYGKSTFPEPMQTTLSCHKMLTQGLAATGQRTHRITIGSPLASTSDDAFAAEIPQATGCHAENLEAFAIAHACLLAQVPFTSVLGATHMVGSRAREDWVQFERQSTIAAAEVVATWIVNGAQGLPHG